MPAFQFQSVLLHQLPDAQGWQIIGIKHNRVREQIALLGPSVDEVLAERWANQAAQNLAGKPNAEID